MSGPQGKRTGVDVPSPMPGGWLLALKAYPTLLRIGFADAIAYRAEFLVWMLTTTMPLVSMALWSTAADGERLGPERMGQSDFVAYFTLTLLVRMLTSSWVLWRVAEDIRTGSLMRRLLLPVNPLVTYSAEQLAGLPLRVALALPLCVLLLTLYARGQVTTDPWLLGCFVVSLPGAWAINFLSMTAIALLAFYIDSPLGLFYGWLALYTLFSGYLIPLSLLPSWLNGLGSALPFRYMLEAPVRMLMGWPLPAGLHDTSRSHQEAALALAYEYGHIALLLGIVSVLWRSGLRRYAAFGA